MEARSEVTARLASPGERADAVSGDNPSARACLHNALLHDQHNLQETFAAIDVGAFESAVRLLTQRKGRVHVLGLRQAAPLASHVALYLNLCLPSVRPMGGAGPMFLEDQLLWIDASDVLLAFTFRRYSVATANAVKVFRQRGGKVVLITDAASAPAAASAHHVLVARSSSASPFDSYTAAFSVCNALLAAVAQRRRKELGAALERGEDLWESKWIRPANEGAANK